jgi:molybdopterin-guanine dinucleotide biosynthesis protein A
VNRPFSAVLLAGGGSSRMGRDKAFLEIGGTPLWQRQRQTLRALGPAEMFLAGPPRREWSEANFDVISDAAPRRGPLGGIVAALRRSQSAHLLVLGIDLPQMPADYLRLLLSLCADECGVVPHRENLFEPLAAVYPRLSLPLAEELLEAPHHSLQEFASRALSRGWLIAREVLSAEEHFFANLNTPADLARFSKGELLKTGRV